MKKIISILSFAGLSLFAGCETIVTLDNGVDARLDAVMKEYIATLASEENGWMASVETSEGYYRYYMSFTDDNMVTMYTDNTYYPKLNGVPKTSTYNVRALQRPVIAFDTYNYIHIPNDPNDGISGGSDNMGLETDFEFEVDSLGQDGVFYLTGRVNRVHATFRPATAEEFTKVKEGALLEVLDHAAASTGPEYYHLMIGSLEVDTHFSPRGVTILYKNEAGTPVLISANTITELNYDVMLAEPVEIAGKKLTGFVWDESTKTFDAVVDEEKTDLILSPETAVSVLDMLGAGEYSTLVSIKAMYEGQEGNALAAAYLSDDANLVRGLEVSEYEGLMQAVVSFTTKKEPNDRMLMKIVFGGGYQAVFTFYLTWDATDSTKFTVGQMTLENDPYGNADFLQRNGLIQFPSYFRGKTFQLKWSKMAFGSYLMGQIEQVGGTGIYYGALL